MTKPNKVKTKLRHEEHDATSFALSAKAMTP